MALHCIAPARGAPSFFGSGNRFLALRGVRLPGEAMGRWFMPPVRLADCGRLPRSGACLGLCQVPRDRAQGQHSAGGAGVFFTGITQGSGSVGGDSARRRAETGDHAGPGDPAAGVPLQHRPHPVAVVGAPGERDHAAAVVPRTAAGLARPRIRHPVTDHPARRPRRGRCRAEAAGPGHRQLPSPLAGGVPGRLADMASWRSATASADDGRDHCAGAAAEQVEELTSRYGRRTPLLQRTVGLMRGHDGDWGSPPTVNHRTRPGWA